jgi:hypothetical protein
MRSRLSYYSVLLLVGLAIISGLIFVMNPFNGAPASASPATQTITTGGAVATNSTVSSTSTTTAPALGGSGLQPGGTLAGVHHHYENESPGLDDGAGNSTISTTTASPIHSQHA